MARRRSALTFPSADRGRSVMPFFVVAVCVVLLAAGPTSILAQASSRPCALPHERSDEPAPTCWTGVLRLPSLPPRPVAWHLDAYPSREDAEAAKGPNGTVVESLGQIWLFTIAEVGWRPTGGKRVAESGPLPIKAETSYTAVYMEAVSDPGMTAAIHTHSGPEAFYTVTGETCLETPEGMLVGRSEGPVIIVPAGPPMLLTATGASRRRAVVLILHDSSQPATTMVSDWAPKGLCGR
jgi:quercetin dioxygenase-like cupin family protein